MPVLRIAAIAAAIAAGYLAAASRVAGTRLCPRWWERFILSRRNR